MFNSPQNPDFTHTDAATIVLRNLYPAPLRKWGMEITVYNDPTPGNNITWKLSYNEASTDIADNNNWIPAATGSGGSTSLLSEAFETDGVQDTFTLTDATGTPYLVEVNGNLQRPGIDYTVAANVVTFVDAPDDSPDGTENLVIHYMTGASITTDFLSRDVVDTTADLSLDFASLKQKIFVGSAAITGNKNISLANSATALVFSLHVQVTGTRSLTFPASFVCQTTESRWNNGTKVLTITDSNIEIAATFDGTLWKMKVTDDFYDS